MIALVSRQSARLGLCKPLASVTPTLAYRDVIYISSSLGGAPRSNAGPRGEGAGSSRADRVSHAVAVRVERPHDRQEGDGVS